MCLSTAVTEQDQKMLDILVHALYEQRSAAA
jgi:hypothetical protein